jgi:hypothetical protein
MRKRKVLPITEATEAAPAPAPPPHVHIIHPTAIYSTDEARAVLRLRASSLRRELREGRLIVSKRCGRYYFTGRMLLDWINGGIVRRGSASNGTA